MGFDSVIHLLDSILPDAVLHHPDNNIYCYEYAEVFSNALERGFHPMREICDWQHSQRKHKELPKSFTQIVPLKLKSIFMTFFKLISEGSPIGA